METACIKFASKPAIEILRKRTLPAKEIEIHIVWLVFYGWEVEQLRQFHKQFLSWSILRRRGDCDD